MVLALGSFALFFAVVISAVSLLYTKVCVFIGVEIECQYRILSCGRKSFGSSKAAYADITARFIEQNVSAVGKGVRRKPLK